MFSCEGKNKEKIYKKTKNDPRITKKIFVVYFLLISKKDVIR